jgi:hypothetical protein
MERSLADPIGDIADQAGNVGQVLRELAGHRWRRRLLHDLAREQDRTPHPVPAGSRRWTALGCRRGPAVLSRRHERARAIVPRRPRALSVGRMPQDSAVARAIEVPNCALCTLRQPTGRREMQCGWPRRCGLQEAPRRDQPGALQCCFAVALRDARQTWLRFDGEGDGLRLGRRQDITSQSGGSGASKIEPWPCIGPCRPRTSRPVQ